MILTKLINGVYVPQFNHEIELSNKISVGTEVYASQKRNLAFHRKTFALLRLAFDNQDKYNNEEIYRQVITMKCGLVHWVKGENGLDYPLPHSWAFDKMTHEQAEQLFNTMLEVIAKELRASAPEIKEQLINYQ